MDPTSRAAAAVRQCSSAPGAPTTGGFFRAERQNAPQPVARECYVTNDRLNGFTSLG